LCKAQEDFEDKKNIIVDFSYGANLISSWVVETLAPPMASTFKAHLRL